jgi:hypothetical protein
MTSTSYRVSLALAACAWLALGCGDRGPAGCRGPGPSASDVRAGARAGDGRADAATPDAATPDAATPDAAASVFAHGVARGAFVEIQEGDYVHIVIRDRAGGLQSFFIAPALPAPVWEPFLTGHHRGKPVEIAWEEVRIYVPESGAEEIIRRATAIRLIE